MKKNRYLGRFALTVLAAVMECYVTPVVMGLFM